MALISVAGQAGCRHQEIARLTAQALRFELVAETRLNDLLTQEFGSAESLPERALRPAVVSILARLALDNHLLLAFEGAELLAAELPGLLRVQVIAPETRRIGSLMLENRLERPSARQLLKDLDLQQRACRKRRFGRASLSAQQFDLILNAEAFEADQVVEAIRQAAHSRRLVEQGFLSPTAEAHVQFQTRLKLVKFGIVPPGKAALRHRTFVHPSEQVFANLLDFYRVAWEYEPRSFPIRVGERGQILEAFTPDFYLPEFDLYVELTTMKQSLVTKKNRKVRLLKELYPNINIQVFYQKDFENLVFKYGLSERPINA